MTLTLNSIAPNTQAPNFRLLNHENVAHNMPQVMGENGLLMVFAGNVWDLGCIRTVLWLQRQMYKLSLHGINAVVIAPNHTYDLSGFFMSIPRNIPFPMLADPDSKVYAEYGVESSGYIMLDSNHHVRNVWKLNAGVVPHIKDILNTVAN